MITKKNLIIAGGLIAAYYVWKKYIKKDAEISEKSMSNASGELDRVSSSGKCVYNTSENGEFSETHITPCNGECKDTVEEQRACRKKSLSRTRNSNLGL